MADNYDYIVIGAGSSGCVLTKRLSEDPSKRVLLLEAGGPDTNRFIHMPAGLLQLFGSAEDWNFSTQPQEHVLGRRLVVPRGKVYGGSSSINAMAYIRGNRADYDGWAALGCTGWDYDSVLPLFRKSEAHNDFATLDPRYHGFEGELRVSRDAIERSPFAEAFVDACVSAGIPRNDDQNGQSQLGAGMTHLSCHDGQRCSSARAFLTPILGRSNLVARPHSLVTRILIKGDRAYGVEFRDERGQLHQCHAKHSVILCAGAIATPQILMLSGIGPADELKRHGIEPVCDAPGVGQNLHDHLFAPVAFLASQQQGLNRHGSLLRSSLAYLRYLVDKRGPAAAHFMQAMAFLDLQQAGGDANFQIHFCPYNAMRGAEFDVYGGAQQPILEDGYMLLASLVQPESRGQLRLASRDPGQEPLIDPQFLSQDGDTEQLLQGMKLCKQISEQKDFDPYRGKLASPIDWSSDEAIIHRTKETLETIYHPVGTCRMGTDRDAVVDPQLRVYGIEGLRVADASIMPRIITGNTNAPCIMIGEKCAELLGSSSPERD